MGLEKFQIVFDNPHGVFYGGQSISGRVVVCISTDKKIRGITLKLKGEAEVRWEEQRQHTSNTNADNTPHHQTETETYTSSETYFENKVNVFGGGNDQTLTAGEHSFPFSYVLPYNMPSSFEGEHGHVRYTARAVIDRPWKFDHEAKTAFTVICPLDLNANPKLAEPVQNTKEKTFCCCCCASGPLSATLTLPTGGAVPGETLLPGVEVDNTSRVHINHIRLKFVKTVKYYAKGSTKTDEVAISQKDLGALEARGSRNWPRETLAIPSLPPSNLSNCHIIDLDYAVRLIVTPSGAHRSLTVTLPIVLGTIPLHQHFANFGPAPSAPPLGWNLAPSAPQRDGSPTYPDLPPPSFAEAVTGGFSLVERGDSEHVQGNTNYTPLYPFYSHQPHP